MHASAIRRIQVDSNAHNVSNTRKCNQMRSNAYKCAQMNANAINVAIALTCAQMH